MARFGRVPPSDSDNFYPSDRRYHLDKLMNDLKEERKAEAKASAAQAKSFQGFSASMRAARTRRRRR